jgi:DNA-binding transcriptional ArsR family regulator
MSDAPEQTISEVETAGKNEEQLSKTQIFEILSADRRQEVLEYLHRNEGEADIGELAEHIASKECECEVSQLNSQQRKRTYVGLYQCHLPKMAKAGVIDYDDDRGHVGLNSRSGRLLKYIYYEEEESLDKDGGFFGRLLG